VRPLPPPTLGNLNPPARGYRYFDHARRDLDPDQGLGCARTRWLLAECALLAYDDEAAIQAAFAGWARAVTPLSDDTLAGFGFAADLGDGDAVLAFRGTQVFKPGDPPRKFRSVAANLLTDGNLGRVVLEDGSRVHRGFHAAAGALLSSLRASGQLETPKRWWLCGHSLGGAIAVLAADALHAVPGHQVAGVLTLGQPRVGDARHVQRLLALPFPIVRVVHGCDAVPSIPPERLGFAHLPGERVILPERRAAYAATVLQHVLGVFGRLRHGIGALSPVALQDHAPLTYVTHCYNEFNP
jgi:hypothetical protein